MLSTQFARWLGRWIAGALALAVLAAFWWWGWRRPEATLSSQSIPIPPLSASAYLNTKQDVGYVGSETCRTCHAGHDRSFRRTGMGRSLALVDPNKEPPDAVYDHPPSKRRYQIERKDGQLWHRELLLTGTDERVILAEQRVRYVVGSGRHSRTYLIDVDGFLQESPATWYASLHAWGMSPGYDGPNQGGFVRPVTEGCLFCHGGRTEVVGLNRIRIVEEAIGCERCHGPGELHAALRRERRESALPDAADMTIVNPAHLPRDLSEATCQQCHLQGDAAVAARGRRPEEYRPGLPLQEFRHDYRLEDPESLMTVTGHVEQLHRSRCYQAAGTLTCLTCHDPHRAAGPGGDMAAAVAGCKTCHPPERCTVSKGRRDQESPDNNCITCHMPRAATEIPHLAFTHHRIGIHSSLAKPQIAPPRLQVLKPVLDLGRLGAADRDRSLGLAYLRLADKPQPEPAAHLWKERGRDRLLAAVAAGLHDPVMDAALPRVRFELDKKAPTALDALRSPELYGIERCLSLFLLAYVQSRQGEPQAALATLKELGELRRNAGDWILRAQCEEALGDSAAALAALEQAVRIDPRLGFVHRQLAEHYRRAGNAERAAWHERLANSGGG